MKYSCERFFFSRGFLSFCFSIFCQGKITDIELGLILLLSPPNAPKCSQNMLMILKWNWACDTLLLTSSHQRRINGRFGVLCTSFNASEAVKIQPSLRMFGSAVSRGRGGGAELRLWHAVPLRVGQSLTKQPWSRPARNVVLQRLQVRRGHGWALPSASGRVWEWGHGSGTPAFPLSSAGPWGSLTSVCRVTQRQAAAPSHYTPLMDGSVSLWPHPPSTVPIWCPFVQARTRFSARLRVKGYRGNTFNYSVIICIYSTRCTVKHLLRRPW